MNAHEELMISIEENAIGRWGTQTHELHIVDEIGTIYRKSSLDDREFCEKHLAELEVYFPSHTYEIILVPYRR